MFGNPAKLIKMDRNIFDFEKILEDIEVGDKIFKPNLTTKLSIEVAFEKLKDDINVLDLGCGSGVIGIALMKSFAKLRMHCSDVHSTAVEITKKIL